MAEKAARSKAKRKRGAQPGNKGNPNSTGRPKGAANKLTKEIKEVALASGKAPLQFLVDFYSNHKPGDKYGEHEVTWKEIEWAIEQALPKFHPDATPPAEGGVRIVNVHLDAKGLATLKPDELKRTRENLVKLQSGAIDIGRSGAEDNPGLTDPFAPEAYNRKQS